MGYEAADTRYKLWRARLRPGRDAAIGFALADAVQTELDPPDLSDPD